jgi:hypothetical protein
MLVTVGYGESLAKQYSKKFGSTADGRQFMLDWLDSYVENVQNGQADPIDWRDGSNLTKQIQEFLQQD